ncbi:MAG: monovalent cation/H+ antiporter complex subunit F [Candidatus Aenigmarchaeota archaeon]|nr:monovalent cation/H+ antiporter complex subunit F [Candidatus Aenigmarchaeota archaeon]
MINEILIISILISCIRLVRGPTLFDRLLMMSIINSIVVSMMFVQALSEQNTLMTDISLVYAFLSMLGIYALTKYLVEK